MQEGFDYFAKLKPLKSSQIVRKIILSRDFYICQFCSTPLKYNECTLDHLDPLVLYKRNEWPKKDASTFQNLVLACAPCNTKKGGRTCEEAEMWPLRTPIVPAVVRLNHNGRMYKVQSIFVERFYKYNSTTGDFFEISKHPGGAE